MRIAHLIDSLGAGGSERSLAEMLPHLARAGLELRVFVLSEPERGFADLVRASGTEVELLPPGGWPRRCTELRRRLLDWRPDLLHTTLFYADVVGRLAAWRSGIPVLSSLVSVSYEPERFADPRLPRWRFTAVRWIDGWTGRHLNEHFHAVSQAAKDSAVRRLKLPPERVTVIRRGRDIERFGEPSRRERAEARLGWGIGENEILIVNVGRQTFHKGQIVLLEAVRRLLAAGLPVRLIIAGGEGPCTGELAGFIDRHELSEHIRVAGHVDAVTGLLAAADVFAFPSRLEGFPGAVLEAMAMALPVVATSIPSVREIFPDGDGALLVEPDSVEGLAKALDRVATDAAMRRALGGRNREMFLDRFDLRKTVPAFVDLYRRVAGSAHRSAEATWT